MFISRSEKIKHFGFFFIFMGLFGLAFRLVELIKHIDFSLSRIVAVFSVGVLLLIGKSFFGDHFDRIEQEKNSARP